MVQSRGFYTQIPIIFENSYGVIPSVNPGDMIQVPFVSAGVGSDENMIESETMNPGKRFETEPSFGHVSVEGPAEVPFDKNYIGYWLKALMGTPLTTPDGDDYIHEFIPGNSNPSFTMDKGYTDIGHYSRFDGMKIDSFSANLELNSELTASLNLMGRSETLATQPLDPTPTELEIEKFFAKSMNLYVDGLLYGSATEMQLEISNNLEGIYTLSSGGFRHSLPEVGFSVSGSFKVLFENRDLYNDAIGNVKKSVTIEMTRGDHFLKFEMPEILFPRQIPEENGKGPIFQPIPFRAFYKNSVSGTPIKATLKNGVQSYA